MKSAMKTNLCTHAESNDDFETLGLSEMSLVTGGVLDTNPVDEKWWRFGPGNHDYVPPQTPGLHVTL
jgi:hypothetical protein